MTKDEFEKRVERSCNLFMEAADEVTSLLAIFDDVGTEIAPSQVHIDAGAALISVIAVLDKGPTSARAKINRVRS